MTTATAPAGAGLRALPGLLQAAETPDGPFRQVDRGTPPAPALGHAECTPPPRSILPAPARRCDDPGAPVPSPTRNAP